MTDARTTTAATLSADTATTAASTATTVTAPPLPATIDGDGRYVMSLLTDFCTDITDEVNRLNGSTSDAIPPAIDNFFVSFDREGVLWEWDSIPTALYYDLTAGTALLERTTATASRAAPPTFSGTVTLTAHLADSSRVTATLDYTKPRPHAPTHVTLSRTSLGTLISYDDIPPDCIGAQITAGGQTIRSLQSSCLIPHDVSTRLGRISAAYYDSFGIGETVTVSTELAAVTGFFAEQNGEWLDLAWDSLPAADLRYTIKIAYRTPDWDSAAELITVRSDRARLRHPQASSAYLLIKALDPYGNTSPKAAWTRLERAADYRRNVILTLDQSETVYRGTKTGLYYDGAANGLRLDDAKRRGEYLFSVHLPQVYRARNWLEAKLIGVTDDTLAWDDSTFDWTSEDSARTVWNGACGDISGAVLATEIAEAAEPQQGETIWTMDTLLTASDGTAPAAQQHADTFAPARWNQGLLLTPLTRLAYPLPPTDTFSLVFHLTTDDPAPAEILTLRGDSGSLTLRYTGKEFLLIGADTARITIPYTAAGRDYLAVGIGQSAETRTLRLSSLQQHTDRTESIPAAPCMTVTELLWHPN